MELFFIILVSISLCFLLNCLLNYLVYPSKPNKNLPPGPSKISLLSKFILGRKSFYELGPIISTLRKKYGNLITIHIGSQATVYIANNSLAYKAFVQCGTVFADRPPSINNLIVSNSKKIITKTPYGPLWRALRRNLTAGVLHPTQVKAFSNIRERVVNDLINRLKQESSNGGSKGIYVEKYFRHAIFSLLVLLCFGDFVTDDQIQEVEDAQIKLLKSFPRFKRFILFPRVGKFLFKKLWTELTGIVTGYDDALRPLIQERRKQIQESRTKDELEGSYYVDTLFNLQVPGEEGPITEADALGLCNEFVAAGTDTTMIALHWTMANIVKYPKIQERILEDIKSAIGDERKTISEEDLSKMPYVKAVVLEGLRRHPPGYTPATPHAVMEDVELGGFTIPKGTSVNFLIADIGRDPNVWENPMEFRPERFLKGNEIQNIDVTGSREIKMMPFGAGRRVCPGYALAMLHMELFVANLVWNFQWSTVDGKEVDLTEKFEMTIAMKNPLGVCLSPRF